MCHATLTNCSVIAVYAEIKPVLSIQGAQIHPTGLQISIALISQLCEQLLV